MEYGNGRVRASTIDWLSLALVIIGAINWGLVGLGNFLGANWNVVDRVVAIPMIESVIYLLIGLAGLYELYFAYQLYRASAETPVTTHEAT